MKDALKRRMCAFLGCFLFLGVINWFRNNGVYSFVIINITKYVIKCDNIVESIISRPYTANQEHILKMVYTKWISLITFEEQGREAALLDERGIGTH
ncbi:UNVERIFIED_ORG: hypothetical protein BDK47_102144 [Anoxybacillus amylolyticus]